VDGQLKTKDTVLHAESNAISKLAKNGGLGSDGSTIYVTVSPCLNCAKLIIQAGIKRVVYAIDYRDDAGTKLLKEAGLELVNLPVLQDFYDTLLSQEQN
jgi:dCMP deaminase